MALGEQQAKQEEAAAHAHQRLPIFTAVSDVYTPEGVEFVVYTDGICVKAQKPTRQKVGLPKKTKPDKRHDTDGLLLPRKEGRPFYLCEEVSDTWSLVEAAQSFLRTEYSGEALSVVALSDGARSIRQDIADLLGKDV